MIAKEVGDWAGKGTSFGNLSNVYHRLGYFKKTIEWKTGLKKESRMVILESNHFKLFILVYQECFSSQQYPIDGHVWVRLLALV